MLCLVGSVIITPFVTIFLIYKSYFTPGVIALVLTSGIILDLTFYWVFFALGNFETYFIGFERCLKFTTVI